MTTHTEKPVIAFVWRPQEITSSVVEMARQTKTRVIFDLTSIDPKSAGPALLQADASSDAVDLKIDQSMLVQPDLEDLIEETDISTLWVELHPSLMHMPVNEYLNRIAALADRIKVIPIVSDLEVLKSILGHAHRVPALALKGSEASGFVSSENLFTLYSSSRRMLAGESHPPRLMVWGGLATPEAVSAFLCTGAAGVVFESLHWLTDLVAVDETIKSRVKSIRPGHTDLTGLNLGVPCRLFNKGNSVAVRQLREFAGSLCGSEIRDEQRRFFAERIKSEAVPALEASFGKDQLIPLGVEAAFADSFAQRFGSSTERAVDEFVSAIEQCCAEATSKIAAFVDSAVAQEMGTRYPFIQGAMSWITDVPAFARSVSEAGGLPTIALGLMNGEVLENKLGRLPEVMEGRPYAVNVITLAENPYREEQLAWIRRTRPRFAVIAAGEPSHAADLMADGIDVMYIAPNEDLVKLAFEAGVKTVICEGSEAGGHVGEHSTLTLSQVLLDLKAREPGMFEGRKIVLAGGIFNRETAFMAAMLGADAIQMGTVYLTTPEIVATGALTSLYQRMILDSSPGDTTVTGEGTGLRVRSLKTPKIEAICSLERDFAAGSQDEASFRRQIEALSAGSLFVAARGLSSEGTPLDESACLEQGQFMSGACAGALSEPRSLTALHEELAQGPLAEGLPFLGPIREAAAPRPLAEDIPSRAVTRMPKRVAPGILGEGVPERIAITGMAVVNALGKSPEEVWAASLAMKSGIRPVPPSRWDHEIFYHPRPRMPEKTYCKVAAFQDIEVSRKELGIPPQDFRTMTSSTKITMWLAKKAIEQSGILASDIPRERIAVLISQNSGEAAATLEDVIVRASARTIASHVGNVLGLSPEARQVVEEEVKAGRIVIDDTTLLGRLNCSAGGFICNKYGFMGPSFSVSAACATALVALYSAYQMIRNGIIDAAVVGGAEEFLTPMHFLEFSALGALAGLSGTERPPEQFSRPFDADRDGMVLGEGGGMIVIERESVARKRQAPVHAYITSMGASNNNLGMVESSSSTQEIALRASFRDASYGPDGVDLVECHATSTRQGDVEEVNALKSLFKGTYRTVLTSFKSQIGHTLGASGLNSLVRGIMAMNSGIFPGNLNYETPDPEIVVNGSGLEIRRDPSEWETRNGLPRRLQVNAFGFGGSNYVVQVEQARDGEDVVLVEASRSAQQSAAHETAANLPEDLFFFKARSESHAYRIAVLAESEEKARAVVEKSEALSNGGPLAAKRVRALARQGIHVGLDTPPAPLAFVFPGQGSHYAGMGKELYEAFPIVRKWMDRAAEVADFDLLQLLFYDREEDLQKTRWQQPALFTMEYAMSQYLWSLGVRPTAMAGHSLGELTALCLAGVYSFEDGFRLVNKRAVCMDKACEMNVDPGIMVACDAPMEVIQDLLSQYDNVYITNLNSPHQIVIGGGTEESKNVGAKIKEMGFRSTQLRVSMAFHSPIMKCIHDELEEFVAGLEFFPPRIPVISNTTMKPFTSDTAEIKRTVMAHLESPVQWMHNVETLVKDFGIKVFVEIGPREVLSNLIGDTIEDADCIQTSLPSAEVTVYKTALAQLFARGHLNVGSVSTLTASYPAHVAESESSPVTIQQPRTAVALPAAPPTVEAIIQREINAFVLDSFGRFLRPAILAAIRRDYDPAFGEEDLHALLQSMFPSASVGHALPAVPVAEPVRVMKAPAAVVPVASPARAKSPDMKDKAGSEDVIDVVIGIIMDATGYERDEIEPDMDLREDLSIRSSRLPVIMDSLEGHFQIKIELEDFMDVRTIRDISDRISEVLRRKGDGVLASKSLPAAEHVEAPTSLEGPTQSVKRVVFCETPLEEGDPQPLELNPFDQVIVAAAVGGTGLRREVGGIIRRDYGATIVPVSILEAENDDEGWGVDLRTEAGRTQAENKLGEVSSLVGLILIVDDVLERELASKEDVAGVLAGIFSLLKGFVESPARKFVLVIQKTKQEQGPGRILSEGALGMLLSAVHEFGSVLFRWVYVDEASNLSNVIRSALDRRHKPVQLIARNDVLTTVRGEVRHAVYREVERLDLGSGDVVVFSGGAYGITPFLAHSLVPFGCAMVFLGRTVIDPDVNFRELLAEPGSLEETAARVVSASRPDLGADERRREVARIFTGLQISRTLEDLRSRGIDASYITCDVTDAERTGRVVQEIVNRYGKIDGVVHAAGVLKDNFIKLMSPEDFQSVVNVKLLGAWNLLDSTKDRGLRFFTCLSSAAAIQGNPGQANYAAGNRAMAALMSLLRSRAASVRCKALMLPPIEGAGMADDEEIKALMARMNATYVRAEELAALFDRELINAPADDVWVMFMRSLPDLPSAPIDTMEPPVEPEMIATSGIAFNREDFPMIDEVKRMDVLREELEAERVFTHAKDLWINDHKPFDFLKHPLVSAIMALETFMEVSRILYPHLEVLGVRNARFLDIIACPSDAGRPAVIQCKRIDFEGPEIVCEASLETREISPTGRLMDRLSTNYRAHVLLGRRTRSLDAMLQDFPVLPERLETRPIDNEEVNRKYSEKTHMRGRYRVIEALDGTSPALIGGHIIYRQSQDFSHFSQSRYQYSPYLLEALIQLANFYILMRDSRENRHLIPYAIGEMRFSRHCKDGERIRIEGRMLEQDQEGITWDSRALDDSGSLVMVVKDLRMRWFSK